MASRSRIDHVYDTFYDKHLHGTKPTRMRGESSTARLKLIERMYFRILTELAANRFKWTGFPESVDVRFLELELFRSALAVAFHNTDGVVDPTTGKPSHLGDDHFYVLSGSPSGKVNMVNNPTEFTVIGNEFISRTLTHKECVPIWANYLRVPDLDVVLVYATKLAELDVTIEINMKQARRTKVIVAPENMRLSAVNINKMIERGDPTIFLNTSLGEMIANVDLGVNPDSIEKLSILRARLWSECMTLLGINNANQDKKERLVASEVDANNDQVASMRDVNLNARRTAARQINLMFGQIAGVRNVKVEFNSDVESQATQLRPPSPLETVNTDQDGNN